MRLLRGRVVNGAITLELDADHSFALVEGAPVHVLIEERGKRHHDWTEEDVHAVEEAAGEFDAGLGQPAEVFFEELWRELATHDKRPARVLVNAPRIAQYTVAITARGQRVVRELVEAQATRVAEDSPRDLLDHLTHACRALCEDPEFGAEHRVGKLRARCLELHNRGCTLFYTLRRRTHVLELLHVARTS